MPNMVGLFGPSLQEIQLLLLYNNEELMKKVVEAMNAQLNCIKTGGKVYYRTAEEDAEIKKRHTHDK